MSHCAPSSWSAGRETEQNLSLFVWVLSASVCAGHAYRGTRSMCVTTCTFWPDKLGLAADCTWGRDLHQPHLCGITEFSKPRQTSLFCLLWLSHVFLYVVIPQPSPGFTMSFTTCITWSGSEWIVEFNTPLLLNPSLWSPQCSVSIFP